MLDERKYLIENIIQNADARILEIGPLNYPVVKKNLFKNCFYCDIRSTEQVKALYSGNDYLETTGIKVDLDSIVDIDYVLKDCYKETFRDVEKFDFVVASHVMEHIEDIIGFLNDIGSVIKPKGKLCILYPDKRYCFDHFREAASFRDAYDVYRRGRQETARMALDFFNTSIGENDPHRFWSAENMSSLMPTNNTAKAIKKYEMVLQGEKMDDVHFWPFTDRGFLRFLYDGVRAHLLPFSCVDFHPAQEDTQQFLTVLEYCPEILEDGYTELKNLTNLIETVPLDYHNSKRLELGRKNVQLLDKLTEAENRNTSLNQCNTELTNSVTSLTVQYQQLMTSYGELKEQNAELNHNISEVVETNAELSAKVSVIIETNAELSANMSVIIEKKDQLMAEVASLQTIQNSTLWRMTKPIRVVLDLLKKPFKKR